MPGSREEYSRLREQPAHVHAVRRIPGNWGTGQSAEWTELPDVLSLLSDVISLFSCVCVLGFEGVA